MMMMMMMMMIMMMMMTIIIWSWCWSLDNGGFCSSWNKKDAIKFNFNLSNLKKGWNQKHISWNRLRPHRQLSQISSVGFAWRHNDRIWKKNNQKFRRVYTNPYHPLKPVYYITLSMKFVERINILPRPMPCPMDGMTYMTFINPEGDHLEVTGRTNWRQNSHRSSRFVARIRRVHWLHLTSTSLECSERTHPKTNMLTLKKGLF